MARLILAIVLIVSLGAADRQPAGGARVLGDMRQALGGETALANLKTFSLTGTLSRNVGERTIDFALDISCELPDKCVRVTRQLGIPIVTVISDGYNADEPIHDVDSPMPPPPLPPFATQDDSPAAKASRRASMAAHSKAEFARLTIALLGASLPVFPLTFTEAGPDTLDGHAVDVLEFTGGKDFAGRLLIDADTHLPAAIIWKTPPLVIMTSSQLVSTRGGEVRSTTERAIDNPRKLPPGTIGVTSPPSPGWIASQPLVERRRVFSDFKRSDGLLWPRRIKDFADDQLAEDLKVHSIKINPKIDPKRFTIQK